MRLEIMIPLTNSEKRNVMVLVLVLSKLEEGAWVLDPKVDVSNNDQSDFSQIEKKNGHVLLS